MGRTIGLFLGLVVTWLLLSGYYFDHPLIMIFGFLSCVMTAWIAHRMDVVDHEAVPYHFGFRILAYWSWLFKQIAKANIAVTKIVFSDLGQVRPQMFKVKADGLNDMGLVILANSVTLTPGTVTVDLIDDELTIHALSKDLADPSGIMEMKKRIASLEGKG